MTWVVSGDHSSFCAPVPLVYSVVLVNVVVPLCVSEQGFGVFCLLLLGLWHKIFGKNSNLLVPAQCDMFAPLYRQTTTKCMP